MPTPNESEILEIIDNEGGESTVRKIAAKMHLFREITRVTLRSMCRNGFIDYLESSGIVRIASKGWSELGKSPK